MSFGTLLKIFLIFIFCFSCSKEGAKKSIINETNLELQMIEAYQEGVEELERGDVLFAAKKFNEAEILFPQSEIAPRAALMAAYAYYSQNYHKDAIAELERFMKVYSNHKDIPYAMYLLGLCFYEQIVNEKKDLESIINSKEIFLRIINEYPNTDFAVDAQFKLDLINDILAAKEMYVGRYYVDRKKWIAAINRFKFVIDNYDTTIYVEEALHRLVEIHYTLGLKEESEKYAKLLGYNYQSSQWYEMTYSVFNEMYKTQSLDKKEKSFVQKVKSLFN